MADDMYGSYDAFMSKTVGPAGGDEGMPVDSQYPYREYTRGVGIVFDESFDEYGTKVIVQKLQAGESASKSRMISGGDMIVAVNGVDVSGREIRFLRSLIPGPRKIIAAVFASTAHRDNRFRWFVRSAYLRQGQWQSVHGERPCRACLVDIDGIFILRYFCFPLHFNLTLNRSSFSAPARTLDASCTLVTKPLKYTPE